MGQVALMSVELCSELVIMKEMFFWGIRVYSAVQIFKTQQKLFRKLFQCKHLVTSLLKTQFIRLQSTNILLKFFRCQV